MIEYANRIYEVIKDYRNDDGIYITTEDISNWSKQFEKDSDFILQELSHLMPQVYFSKERAKKCLLSHIEKVMIDLNYNSINLFLTDTEFLDLQDNNKSQKAILGLLKEVVALTFGLAIETFQSFPKKNYLYFDDVLATGGTVFNQLNDWLNRTDDKNISFAQHIRTSNKRLIINLFCWHTWGRSFQTFRLKKTFGDDLESKIRWYLDYEIQNHVKWNKQSLNIAIPQKHQPTNVESFLANLSAEKYSDYAYRQDSQPDKEVFFSSPENRIRYENIILQKGLYIISMINGVIKPNIRPLGLINPNYKTFGLGTHFFTWRNIPNNSPLIFWWEVPGHNWKPLFPVANRGIH